jgi:Oxygenase domain of the 2OGFeDO superfamily
VVVRRLRLEWRPAGHLEGDVLDKSYYDHLVEIETDGIGPDGALVFKYRKAAFTVVEQRVAYDALRAGATMSDSRGPAAGHIRGRLGNRDWVTSAQLAILLKFINGKELEPASKSTRAYVWDRNKVLADHAEYDGWFDRWHEWVKGLPADEQKAAAKHVLTYISKVSHSVTEPSGTSGYLPRDGGLTPYGRATGLRATRPKQFAEAIPFIRHLNDIYKAELPDQWQAQSAVTEHIDPWFLIGGTVFSTLTINYNWQTKAHRDDTNLEVGFSCLVALGRGWQGGEFIMPEYRVAVRLQPGDLLMLPSHEVWHANAPLANAKNDRLTIVTYLPKGMQKLGSWAYELARKHFYKQHKGLPDMWRSQAWADYLRKLNMVDEDR